MIPRDSGAALVEFAIGLIFLTVVLFGTIDMTRAFFTWNQVKNAAREGAAFAERDPLSQRQGASCPEPNTVEYRAQTEDGSRRNDFAVSVSPAVAGGCQTPSDAQSIKPGDHVTVRVTTTFEPITPVLSAIVGTLTIGASQEVTVQG